MRLLAYALMPLLVLVTLASVSCLLGYLILLALGDVVELSKVISKGTQVLLVLSIVPLMSWLKMTWAELGFANKSQFIRQMGLGLLLGVATLLPVLLVLYGLDIHVIDQGKEWTVGKAATKIVVALLLALLISFFEEPVFRGLLLASFRRKMAVGMAIFLSSFYYAALHFLKTKTKVPYQDLSPESGFRLMTEAFGNWLNPEIFSALLALLVVGVFLAVVRTEFGNGLGICVGCHAAWVWQIKVSKDFFDTDKQAEYYYLVSGYDGVVGPLVTVWLSLAIAAYYLWKKYKIR
ncbi:CPBP family intramembrane glutamic endopeptidase [Methylomarinum sp. Ch1-1]|uniref:CPBP family intramembrane glutamic endopeptidase n=1 Tax=Methylomarinum roseum TaxID=3067653 RepID=A0AAU7NWY9_9GAMM